MNIELDCGVASRYFVSDYARSLAIVEAPCALVLTHDLNVDGLAAAFADLAAEGSRGSGPRRASRGREDREIAEATAQWRDRLRTDFREIVAGRPAFSFGHPHPIVVLAESISEEALVVMVIIKLRGIVQILAVDLSATGTGIDQLFREHKMPSDPLQEFQSGDLPHRIFRIDEGLSVVAGLSGAVLSEMDPEEIVEKYPDLPMPPPEEPITYPALPGAS